MIAALLSWWDEEPTWLTRAIVPLGRFAEHVVALDGAYAAVPGAELRPDSPGPQADAVVAAADAAGIGLTLHRSTAPWPGEVEKRTALFRAAALVCRPGDWVFVIDADEHIVDVPDDLAEQLEAADAAVATIELADADGSMMARRFFRWDESLRVEGAHCIYVAGDAVLWGPGEVPSAHVRGFRVEHLQALRDKRRRDVQLAYYERRDRLGLETTARVPSGGAPVYAFEPRQGSRHFAIVVSPEEYAAIMARGYAQLDGVRADVVVEECDEQSGFMRFVLAEPYQVPA